MLLRCFEQDRGIAVLAVTALLVVGHASTVSGQAAEDPWPDHARMQLDESATQSAVGPIVRISWRPPRADALPTVYDLQVVDIDAADTTTFEMVELEVGAGGELTAVVTGRLDYLRRYQVRVRGKQGAGIVVPWSSWSPVYAFDLPGPDPGPDRGP